MTSDVLGVSILALLIAAMVGLAVAALQPTRLTVRLAAVALGLLPVLIVVSLLVGWVIGQ